MSKLLIIGGTVVCMIVCQVQPVAAEVGSLPPGSRVLDPDILLHGRPDPTISPDGKWVAYVSQGFVCVCSIENPKPRRIMEVPYSFTWPHFKAPAGQTPATGSFAKLARGTENREYNELHAQVKNTVEGLNWTRTSDGFVFGVQTYDVKSRESSAMGYFAAVDGKLTRLSRIEPNSTTRGLIVGDFTEDRRYLVGKSVLTVDTRRWGPLIWDIERNQPRATPYLTLVPSSTSGHWIGIEKDSRQLVMLDEELKVTTRFEQFLPDRTHGFRLDWSPDERFILWRNQIGFDHYSNWEGFRLNIDTGEKRPLEGRFMHELFACTGNGGEFIRCGQDGVRSRGWSGDIVTGAHLTIVPEGFGSPLDVWKIVVGRGGLKDGTIGSLPGYPPLRTSAHGKLFAIGLPRLAGERTGWVWHLMNRAGRAWQVPGEDKGEFNSPFDVTGFADQDKLMVAYDKTRLFTIPVSAIVTASNEIE